MNRTEKAEMIYLDTVWTRVYNVNEFYFDKK